MSEIKQAESIEPLLPLLAHADSYVRAAALRAIRELRPVQALNAIVANIHHADVQVRREAVSTLGWLKQASAQSLLAELAINDPDAEVRRIATGALGISEQTTPAIEQALLSALTDEIWQIRVEAALTLGKVKPQSAIIPLITALADPYWQVRIPAARSLGKLKATQAVEALALPLQHEISNLRKEAALALGEIGGRRALQLLLQACRFFYAILLWFHAGWSGRWRQCPVPVNLRQPLPAGQPQSGYSTVPVHPVLPSRDVACEW